MKAKIVLLLTVTAGIALSSCTGSPAPIDSRGNITPQIQNYTPGEKPAPQVMTYESGNYIPQYNPDGSMTLFTVNGVEVKIMPMTRRNSRGGSIPVTNEFDALIAKYTDTVRENPQDFDACIMLAGLYFRRNRPGNSGEGIPADAELAVKYSNQALGLGINDPQALYLRGLAYANQGKNPQALTDFEVVLKSNLGTMKGVYYIMGMLFIRENRKDEAIEAFEKVQILDPDFGDTNTILEQLYSMR